MGKKRPVSLLRRAGKPSQAQARPSATPKQTKPALKAPIAKQARVRPHSTPPRPSQSTVRPARPNGAAASSLTTGAPGPWKPVSTVHVQAAHALDKLISACKARRMCNMKSLTLGPHIQAKRATHAVTVETVRHLFLLRKVVAASGVLERFPRLTESVAYVLAYDALLGEGIRPIGGAERAVLKCKVGIVGRGLRYRPHG